ncbi:MAK10-like protein [Tanacetum coccineum]
MGDENPILTLGDYSRPGHKGYRNTIELPDGNNVMPLRSDTIWERARLFQIFYDHVNPATRLTINQSVDGKLRDKNAKESWALLKDLALYDNESWNDPRDFAKLVKAISLPQDVPSTSDRLVSNFMASQDARLSKFKADFKQQQGEMTNKIKTVLKAINDRMTEHSQMTRQASSLQKDQLQMVNKIGTSKPKEPTKALEDKFKDLHLNLPVLEVLAHAPMYNAILDNLGDSKTFDTLADLGSCVNLILLYLFKKLKTRLQEETDHVFGLADGTKSYPVGIVKNIEVHIGRLKLFDDIYVIDMDKDPATPLLVGRGFLATASAVIDCKNAKIAVGEGVTRSIFGKDFVDYHLPDEWEIARDAEFNPFEDVLVFRRMVEFLGVIPINLKVNMWESEDMIENKIDWNKPPKRGDGAGHAKIRLIDPDGEEFTKTFQSIPTTRKLPEKALEDEFKNLHLNLPVLEVLAHALVYNTILDMYVESLELGKNVSTFIQGKTPEKMKDPGLFTLPAA